MKFAKIFEILCFLAWFLISLLSDTLLCTWTMSKLWHAVAQLGIWISVAVVAWLLLHTEADEECSYSRDDKDSSCASIVQKTLWGWVVMQILICIALCIESMVHWVK